MMKRNTSNVLRQALMAGMLFLLATIFTVLFNTKAFADENNLTIDRITIENTNEISNRIERPWISISSNGCYAEEDIYWEKDFKYVRAGEIAYGTVLLRANYGYQFDWSPQVYSRTENLSATVQVISDEEARLLIEYVVGRKLPNVQYEVYKWGDRYLEWKKVSNASEYELSFFNAYTNEYYTSFNTTKTKFDLNKLKKQLSRDEREEDVYCEIKALSDRDYLMESEIETSITLTLSFRSEEKEEENPPTTSTSPSKNRKCEWVKKKDGSRYYTEKATSKNATGWQLIEGEWYYLNPSKNGKMVTGWMQVGKNWYYFTSSGKMVSDTWKQINKKYYYFYEDGSRAQDCWIGEYYVNSKGVWVSKK